MLGCALAHACIHYKKKRTPSIRQNAPNVRSGRYRSLDIGHDGFGAIPPRAICRRADVSRPRGTFGALTADARAGRAVAYAPGRAVGAILVDTRHANISSVQDRAYLKG